VEEVRGFAPEARWIKNESLHITLKFVGETPEDEVARLKQSLEMVNAGSFAIKLRGLGFFPEARAPRVFWAGIEAGEELASLAAKVDDMTAQLGIPREEHGFTPHLTLARGAGRSGSPRRLRGDSSRPGFQLLQEKLSKLPHPEFGHMTLHNFFLYQSHPSKGGSSYTKLAKYTLIERTT
jgi:2'-5' RNA ligase